MAAPRLAGAVAAAGLWTAPAPAAPAVVRLVLQLTPGTEQTYAFTSTLTQDMADTKQTTRGRLQLEGLTRQVVAEADPRTGVALVGWLGTGRWQLSAGAEATPEMDREQTWIAAYRTDRSGRSILRERKKGDQRQYLLHHTVNAISENAQVCAAFPAEPVAVGGSWQGPVLLPLPGARQRGTAVSRVVALGQTNGLRTCTIRSELVSGGEQSYATWRAGTHRPEMRIEGFSEGCFDLAHGRWITVRTHLRATFAGDVGGGFSGVMDIDSVTRLGAVRTLPAAEAADMVRRVKALDVALARLYAGDTAQGLAALTTQQAAETDAAWQKGLGVALALVQEGLKMPEPVPTAGGTAATGAEALLQAADQAAREAQPQEAERLYLQLAERFPAHALAPEALAAAAALARQGGRTAEADALSRRALALREGTARPAGGQAADPLALYRLAGAYAEAGQLEQAQAAYAAFLACPGADIPASTRLLAQYRAAGLLERLGRRAPALDAYAAAARLPAPDDYARQLQARAQARAEALRKELGP